MTIQILDPNTAVIPADVEYIEEVRDYFTDFLHEHTLGFNDIMAWQLAFTEVVSNAILHGSKPKTDDQVQVSWSSSERSITLSVTDNGSGPAPELTQNPQLPKDPLATSGRGMYIIAQFTDQWAHTKSQNSYTQSITKFFNKAISPS